MESLNAAAALSNTSRKLVFRRDGTVLPQQRLAF